MMQAVREQELRLTQEEALKFVVFPPPSRHIVRVVSPLRKLPPTTHPLLPPLLRFLNIPTFHSEIAQVLSKIIICVFIPFWKCEFLEAKRPFLKEHVSLNSLGLAQLHSRRSVKRLSDECMNECVLVKEVFITSFLYSLSKKVN